jgi:hypothetical protein
MWRRAFEVWEERRLPVDLATHDVGPTCARHVQTVRGAPSDSPRGTRTVRDPARTVRKYLQSIQYLPAPLRPTRKVRATLADGLPGQVERSAPLPRTVRAPLSFQLEIFREKDCNDELFGIIVHKTSRKLAI